MPCGLAQELDSLYVYVWERKNVWTESFRVLVLLGSSIGCWMLWDCYVIPQREVLFEWPNQKSIAIKKKSSDEQSFTVTTGLCFDIPPPPPPIHILFCITFFRMSLMCDFKSQTAFTNKYFKCYFSWHQHWYTIIFFVNVLNKNVIYSGFISIKCFSIFHIYICILFYLYIL